MAFGLPGHLFPVVLPSFVNQCCLQRALELSKLKSILRIAGMLPP